MDKPTTRLDTKKLRKTLREIGSLRRSNLPEKTRLRLRIVSWYGRKTVETICRFFNISKSGFYRLLNTLLNEGLKGLMKRPGRPRGSTIPETVAHEIRRVREANPRIGSRRLKWLLELRPHHATVHRLLRGLGLVKERPYRRRVWKRFRAETPNQRWQIDIAETLLDGRSLYKIIRPGSVGLNVAQNRRLISPPVVGDQLQGRVAGPNPTKKRGLVLRTSEELDALNELFQYERLQRLLGMLDDLNQFKALGEKEKVIEL